MYDPRAPPLAAVVEERKNLCSEEELNDMGEDAKKKEEHLFHVISPAKFNQAVTPISPVWIWFNSFSRPHFLLLAIVYQSSPIQTKTSNPLCLLVWISPLILSSRFIFYFFPFKNTL